MPGFYICGMTYQQTIDYLYSALPMFSRIGAAAYKKDLTNTIALCNALGNPQQQLKSIHIAGTNGKGSVSHMLAAILQQAGYKTGLYTSPHLHDFRERIKINGALCDEQFVIDFTQRIQPLVSEIEPSFFEITVAMAFTYFVQEGVDIAVIETGLGGRLDSTNIITPELSIITNIGYDHVNLLGDTLTAIAGEKAGIIKPGIKAIIGEYLPETKPVFEHKATSEQAALVFAQEAYYVVDWQYNHHRLQVEVVDTRSDAHLHYHLDLTGIYQTRNLLSVLAAIHELRAQGWHLPEQAVHTALHQVKRLTGLHGRWEVIQENPTVVLDVGHNEDGIKQILQQLEHSTYRKLYIVTGMVKDKDIDKVLRLLPAYATYYFTQAQIPRALPYTELAAKAAAYRLQGKAIPDVNTALTEALTHAGKEDLVLVCGSVFLVGEVTR